MLHTIICGMDAHDNTLANRIGVDREAPETMTVKNTQDGRGWHRSMRGRG
jgi:hypothetical protein